MALSPNVLQPFLWGSGGAALTPEQVAREREIANALLKQGIDTSPVGDWTQGAARMANALVGRLRENRANKAEQAGRSAFSDRLSNLFNAQPMATSQPGFSGPPPTSPAMASTPVPDYASSRVAQAHSGASVPEGERAEYIRQGLLQRGLPNHVADAFLLNFQDESGLNPGINEVSPIVPGSRGGYGLYQLTGPRRRAYEAFAGERGVPLDDIDAQLDFLMQEGAGPEKAAFERILSAPDTGTAAAEIVNRFLRPAPEHRKSRASRYMQAPNTAADVFDPVLAASASQQSAVPSMPPPTMVQDQPIADVAQALTNYPVNPDLPMAGNTSGFLPIAQSLASQQQGGMPGIQQLIELASDPWATDAQRQVVGALLQRELQANDPYRQAQLEKVQLEIEALRNPQQTAPAAYQALALRARDAGLQPGTPEYQQFMAQGGRSADETAPMQRISRMTENLMRTGDFIDPQEAQNVAEGIVDGRLRADRHPVTGALQVVDMATGRVVYGSDQAGQGEVLPAPAPDAVIGDQFGTQFPASNEAFGLGGAAQGAINTVFDAAGIGAPYPEVQQTQSDFDVLRESLLNDIASAYNRQPPSWLLAEIRALTPVAGSVTQGAGSAQSKLRSLGRHLENELRIARGALGRELSPENRQKAESQVVGIEAGLARVAGALQSFQGQPQQGIQDAEDVPQGIDPADWQYMTPEERALFK